MRRLPALGFAAIVGLVDGIEQAVGAELHVPRDYPTIQAAVDAAEDGDEIVLADGVYTGPGNRDVSPGPHPAAGHDLTIRSVNGPAATIIDCENTGRAFAFIGGNTPTIVLEGVTIRNGASEVGAAIKVVRQHLTVINCVLEDNHAGGPGGAIWSIGPGAIVLRECQLVNNSAIAAGGLFMNDGDVTAVNCRFAGNLGDSGGGGAFVCHGTMKFVNCLFADNESGFHGGGCTQCGDATFVNCAFSRNTGVIGGGLNVESHPTTLTNCTFSLNEASAVHVYSFNHHFQLFNSILWGNSPCQFTCEVSSPDAVFSNIEGGWPGIGNINADPLFVQPGSDDLRLSFGSPCLNVGDAAALPPDEFDLDNDGDTMEPLPIDLAGAPRVQDGVVDMGAYEGAFDPMPPMAQAPLLPAGQWVLLTPSGAPFNPIESSTVAVTNLSGGEAIFTVTEIHWDAHPGASGFSELDVILRNESSLPAGQVFERVFIPIDAAMLAGAHPFDVELTRFDETTGDWSLAVALNTASSPGHEGPVGDRITIQATGSGYGTTNELGDHGVFWNPELEQGFAWANVDTLGDFAIGTPLCTGDIAPEGGDGSIDSTDLHALLQAWGPVPGSAMDLNGDGLVNAADLGALLGAWGECDAGATAAMVADAEFEAPHWGAIPNGVHRLGDFDGNRVIDSRDVARVYGAWGECDGCEADLNRDGRVDREDHVLLLDVAR